MEKNVTWKSIIIYALAAIFLCYEMALQVSPSVMTHDLMRDLHIDAAGLGIVAGLYFYSYTLMQIPAGLSYDRLSTRLIMTVAIFICALGGLFFGFSQYPLIAAIGRFFMGIGSAFAFIGVLVVAANWFPGRYFAFLVGVAQMLAAIGALGGEAPLAEVVDYVGWRTTIQWIGYTGFILMIFVLWIVRDRENHLVNDIKTKNSNLKIVESLRIILKNKQTYWIALYAFCGWAPVTVFTALWGVPYVMKLYGIDHTLAGFICSMTWIGLAIASPILGWLSDRLKRRCILLTFCAGTGLITSLIVFYVPGLPLMIMSLLLFCFGIAASGQILTFALVKDNNRSEVTATAVGFNNMAVVAGGALFQPLVGLLLRWHWSGQMVYGAPEYAMNDYRIALLVVPLCFLIGLIASRTKIRETYCQSVDTRFQNYPSPATLSTSKQA